MLLFCTKPSSLNMTRPHRGFTCGEYHSRQTRSRETAIYNALFEKQESRRRVPTGLPRVGPGNPIFALCYVRHATHSQWIMEIRSLSVAGTAITRIWAAVFTHASLIFKESISLNIDLSARSRCPLFVIYACPGCVIRASPVHSTILRL